MAVQTGTATGHLDLLNKLVLFLTTNAALVAAGQQWTVLRDASPPAQALAGQREIQFRAPGLAGADEIFTSIVAYQSTENDYYNWSLRGGVGFLSSVSAALQPGASPEQFMCLSNGAIQYWFVANGRRVIVVAKISTTYQMAHLGFYLPYATPTQFPYPLLVGASTSDRASRWSNSNTQHSAFWDPAENSSSFYHVDGTWMRPANRNNAASPATLPYINMAPYGGEEFSRRTVEQLRDNVDGTYALFPIQPTSRRIDTDQSINVFGELDGLYYVSGHNSASENTVTVGGVQHLVVQNIFRTARQNYAALRLA